MHLFCRLTPFLLILGISTSCISDCCRGLYSFFRANDAAKREITNTEPLHDHSGHHAAECMDIMSVLPILSQSSPPRMQTVCESRFDELHKMHKEHQRILDLDQEIEIHGVMENENDGINSQLMVLDLDHTIMDQVLHRFVLFFVFQPITCCKRRRFQLRMQSTKERWSRIIGGTSMRRS